MQSTATVPTHMQPAVPPPPEADGRVLRAAARYTIWLALIEIVALFGAFWAATRPWFMNLESLSTLRMMGYGVRESGKNCDVVLYGDSTALAGLDPGVIQSETGMTACNIAEPRPVLEVVGINLPLDQYLAHNRPPKFLVTAWAPGDFDLEHPRMNSYFVDGFLYEFQYNRGPWLWRTLIRHPRDTIAFLLWVQGSIIKDLGDKLGLDRADKVDDRVLRDSHGGQWRLREPPQRACWEFPPFPWIAPAQMRASVAKFREQYATRTEHLLVDITPVADCFVEGRRRIATVKGLYDNTAQMWPVTDFSTLNIHLTPQAARMFSGEVAGQIKGIQEQDREDSSSEHAVASR